MSFRNKTLRSMTPVTRTLARMVGELNSIATREKNLLKQISALEDENHRLNLVMLHGQTTGEWPKGPSISSGTLSQAALFPDDPLDPGPVPEDVG